ncbi:MAG: biotin attachment protein [Acidimicrobiia bacterium]|nr:biotin attachment protein [Acidimicrobiia bacterium]
MAERSPIVVPHSGVVETVFIVEWLRATGERVEEGEEVVTVESEKAETAIEAPAGGTLEILIHADPETDVEVDVGTTIGHVLG